MVTKNWGWRDAVHWKRKSEVFLEMSLNTLNLRVLLYLCLVLPNMGLMSPT